MKKAAIALALVLVCCGTSQELQDLGDRFGCDTLEETGKVDMHGTGLVAFCEGLPGGVVFLFWFKSTSERNRFFTDVWPETKFRNSFVLVGTDWAVASDANSISAAAALRERVGGTPLNELKLVP